MSDMTHDSNVLIVSTKERWLKLHLEQGYTISEISRLSGFSRDTLHRWKRNYLKHGVAGLIEKPRAHHSYPYKTLLKIEKKIIQIRRKYGFCAQKINLRLAKEGITIHTRTVHKILKRNGLVRKRRRSRRKDIYHKRETTYPGELMEIDVKYAFKVKDRWWYQFTAIDDYSRWRCVEIFEEQNNLTALTFLNNLVKKAPFKIRAIKTDNASIFINRYTGYSRSSDPLNPRLHVFDKRCLQLGIVHYLIDPGKPQQNGKVERSHRTDNEEFYSRNKFKSIENLIEKQKQYIKWYNTEREHLSLEGLTPLQVIKKCQR